MERGGGFIEKSGVFVEKGGDLWGREVCRDLWWKNGGFSGKWGFRGFLVKKSGKSREEPGI